MGFKLYRKIRRAFRGGKPTGPEWHRAAVGGMWDTIGRLQLDFLVARGLRPEHRLLDIGCGALRGGVHFIAYLAPGHYYGIEHDAPTLEAGRTIELRRYNLEARRPNLYVIGDFDLAPIPAGVLFEFMLAQSVFTHLTPEMIARCVRRVTPRLAPGGVLFATFREADDDTVDPGRPHRWRENERRGTKYPFRLFQDVAAAAGVSVEYLGDWGHPRGQRMMAFTR
jgi:SAM-dependent methyltransferase